MIIFQGIFWNFDEQNLYFSFIIHNTYSNDSCFTSNRFVNSVLCPHNCTYCIACWNIWKLNQVFFNRLINTDYYLPLYAPLLVWISLNIISGSCYCRYHWVSIIYTRWWLNYRTVAVFSFWIKKTKSQSQQWTVFLNPVETSQVSCSASLAKQWWDTKCKLFFPA